MEAKDFHDGRLRILHTENSLGWGGQELRILAESEGLRQRGDEVAIACPREGQLFKEGVRRGIEMIDVPIAKRSLRGVLALRKLASSGRFDVINTHSSTDSWLTAIACATLRAAPPIVRTRHISAPIPNNAATRWLYAQAAHVVTTGERLRESLVAKTGIPDERVTSVPTGVDLDRFAPGDRREAREHLGIPADIFAVGIVATLRGWKGHSYLLDAVAPMVGVTTVIVGNGPQWAALHEQAARLGIERRVIFAGNQDDVSQWLRAFDVFVLPSYANEGVPQAILQAAATRLPIISTPIGSIAEAVEHEVSGLLVPPRTVLALRKAIDLVRNDAALGARLGAAARAAAITRFGLPPMITRMRHIFSAVTRRHT